MGVHKLSILVEAIGAAKAAKGLKGLDATISRIGARGGEGLRTAAHNIQMLGVAAAGVAVVGLAASVKAATDFEGALQTINTVAMATPAELAKIGDAIRKVARETGTPLSDLTTGYYDLVSAGISAADATNVLTNANTLSIGGLSTAGEAIDLLTTAINSYGGDASQAGRYADVFAKTIERGKITAADLGAVFAQVAPLAATMGISVEELGAGFANMTAKGVPAAEAATQMSAAMTVLMKHGGPLKKLEKQTKRNYEALAGKKGLAYAYEVLAKDAKAAGIPLIELTGRKEALLFALANTGTEMESYTANLEAMTDASGTAAAQMAERQKGLLPQLQKLKALALDAGITIGEKLLPKITPLAEKAVAFLNTHQADISAFGDKIAGGFDKALAFAQKIPWETIGAGLKTAAEWSGKLMDTFLNLPPEVQSTIIALAGLNKLSGGAITGIAGELGKGLIKGVLGINAGVVNVRGAVVNGGGGIPGVAGAAGAGAVPGAAAAAGGLLAPGLGVAVAGAAVPLIMFQLIPKLAAMQEGFQPEKGVGKGSDTDTGQILTRWQQSYMSPTLLALQKVDTNTTKSVDMDRNSANVARSSMVEDRIASRAVQGKLAEVRSAAILSASAIREKDWSVNVKVPVTVNSSVTIRGINVGMKTQAVYAGGKQLGYS